MKRLGIYFGLNAIGIVEVQGRRISAQSQIPIATSPDPTKLASLLEQELAKLNISTRDTIITLASKDLIIRSFDLPIMPRSEVAQAVSSEAIKYIPFKIDDLTFDFDLKTERKERRNSILFVAIKNADLERNISILQSARLNPVSLEYSAFSILRLLKLSGINEKGTMAFVDIDIEDEANISILEDGFPYFSRNLKILTEEAEKADSSNVIEKIKSEVKISLDYYRRKFPNKQLKKAVFLIRDELKYEIESICKDLDLTPSFVKIPAELEERVTSGLGIIKAYAALLEIKMPFSINVLSGKDRAIATSLQKEISIAAEIEPQPPLRIQPGVVGIGILLIAAAYLIIMFNKILPLKKEIAGVISQRQPLYTVSIEEPYNALVKVESDYKKKLKMLQDLFKKRQYISPKFDFIPRLLGEGMWLTSVSYNESPSRQKLLLKGIVYLDDSDKEVGSIQRFLEELKRNEVFRRSFDEINLTSYSRQVYKNVEVTNFEIDCFRKIR